MLAATLRSLAGLRLTDEDGEEHVLQLLPPATDAELRTRMRTGCRRGRKAAPGNQGLMVRASPVRFFVPPYVGPSGWVGVWLDRRTGWNELAELLRDAYRLVAPKRLLREVP
jgi:hypothetical protein